LAGEAARGQSQRVMISCTDYLTLELIIFKLSYLRNYAVYFVETSAVYVE